MHYPVIKEDEYYQNIVTRLLLQVSEFQSVFTVDDEPYLVFGEFGHFVVKNLDNDDVSRKVFNFIAEALFKGGRKTENIIVLQIFQQIYADEVEALKARKYMNDHALKIFDEFHGKYNKLIQT